MQARKRVTSSSQRLAKSASPRACASGTKRFNTVTRKNAIHTLSPLPSAPTRFMPSFQSPPPISGSPRAPNAKLRRIARIQCSYRLATSSETLGNS